MKKHIVGRPKTRRAINAALEATKRYQASLGLPIKTQQRFYDRMMKLASKVASESGLSSSDVLSQLSSKAKESPVTLQPGKDY